MLPTKFLAYYDTFLLLVAMQCINLFCTFTMKQLVYKRPPMKEIYINIQYCRVLHVTQTYRNTF